MNTKIIFFIAICVCLLFSEKVSAQSNDIKLIQKGKYAKAEKNINKALKKDSLNAENLHAQALLLTQKKYTGFHVLHAYYSINKSISFYQSAEAKQKEKWIKNDFPIDTLNTLRDRIFSLALEQSIEENSITGYQYFIDTYKEATTQKAEAIKRRDVLAYADASRINTEESYQYFISTYPLATQKSEAVINRDTRAYEKATAANTSAAMKQFMNKYPQSHLKQKASEEFDRLQFVEETDGTLEGYLAFCRKHKESRYLNEALDSVFTLSEQHMALDGYEYMLKNHSGYRRFDDVAQSLIDVFGADGEYNTLRFLNDKYAAYMSADKKDQLDTKMQNASVSGSLFMNIGMNSSNEAAYQSFVQNNAPSELAFVALQRMIESPLKQKDWTTAISILQNNRHSFSGHPLMNRTDTLITVLQAAETGLKIMPTPGINTNKDEYSPVPSFDGKNMYFCGKNRADNVGGEDIFEATRYGTGWSTAKIISSLSSSGGNEAPLSVSADGNTMLLWSSTGNGDILFSEKQKNGSWSTPSSFEFPINSNYYEGDAMLTADGKGMIFVSTRLGGRNLYTTNPDLYHGDNLYPTDVYISIKDASGNWQEPVNLGAAINTPFSERTPFLHPDGKTLYFSSDGHHGLGRMDVYKSTRLNDSSWTQWSAPVNMGKEINGTENDWGFKISTDGKTVYYSARKKTLEKSSLILLVDVSGSMDGSKIIALRKAATEVCISALENNSEVAVLAFDADCSDPIRYFRLFSNDANELVTFIQSLEAGGMTPMYEAMMVACNYMKQNKSPDSKSQMIILMTDGDANGCTTLPNTISYLKNNGMLYKFQTIALEVYEGSQAYNDLNQIAKASRGKFFHAKTADDLGTAFAEASSGLYDFQMAKASSDILQFPLPNSMKPDYVATVSGKLLDRKNQPVSATMRWEDLSSGKNMGESKTNPVDGSYFIILPLGKMYGYYVDQTGYWPQSNFLDLRSANDKIDIQVDVPLVTIKEMIDEQLPVPVTNIFFETARYDLKPESYPELNRLTTIINANPGIKVEIAGHTDNVGTAEFNQTLSEQRAQAVADYLIQHGVDSSRVSVKGYGFSKPQADNNTEAGRAKNRRVEFRFLN